MNTKRFYTVLFVIAFSCSAGLPRLAWAVPAAPIVHELTQPDGTKMKAVKWGDEFSHGWETENGYAIRLDEQSRNWKYVACAAVGTSAMLPQRAGIDLPPTDLQRHSERTAAQPGSSKILRKTVGKIAAPSQRVVDPTAPGRLLVYFPSSL